MSDSVMINSHRTKIQRLSSRATVYTEQRGDGNRDGTAQKEWTEEQDGSKLLEDNITFSTIEYLSRAGVKSRLKKK